MKSPGKHKTPIKFFYIRYSFLPSTLIFAFALIILCPISENIECCRCRLCFCNSSILSLRIGGKIQFRKFESFKFENYFALFIYQGHTQLRHLPIFQFSYNIQFMRRKKIVCFRVSVLQLCRSLSGHLLYHHHRLQFNVKIFPIFLIHQDIKRRTKKR